MLTNKTLITGKPAINHKLMGQGWPAQLFLLSLFAAGKRNTAELRKTAKKKRKTLLGLLVSKEVHGAFSASPTRFRGWKIYCFGGHSQNPPASIASG